MAPALLKTVYDALSLFARCAGRLLLVAACLWGGPAVWAQPAAATDNNTTDLTAGTTGQQIAALAAERTNAWIQVLRIVNKPAPAYARTEGLEVSVYSPGWFHPGAIKPNFDTVDVRQSRELSYASQPYVTSDLNPGVVFMGRDLEFNSMTKYFYVNRSLPKRKLSEAEMLEINRLYRIIGHCEAEMRRLQPPVVVLDQATDADTNTSPGAESGQSFAAIRKIPQATRRLYGGIAIGALVVLMVGIRLVKGKSE